jgi:hypothetical protein
MIPGWGARALAGTMLWEKTISDVTSIPVRSITAAFKLADRRKFRRINVLSNDLMPTKRNA